MTQNGTTNNNSNNKTTQMIKHKNFDTKRKGGFFVSYKKLERIHKSSETQHQTN